VFGGLDQMRNEWQSPEQSGAEDDACQNFSDNFGLAQADEQIAQQLGKSDEKQENEEYKGQRGI
jgi:hypothetical protein